MKKSTKLMTSGSISKIIIAFAIPIFLGNLFQQLYNTVDSLVVGNFVNKEALAAITSCGPLIFLLVGLFAGIFVGAGVVISKYFGKNEPENVKLAIHTAVAFALVSSVILTIAGYFATPFILHLMGTPDDVYEGAKTYIQIYFLGISGLIMYNSAAGILQAMGDSKHPLYFLIVASLINIILDIVFVVYLGFGIAGTAYATIIGQAVSAILSYKILFKSHDLFRVNIKEIRFNKNMLKQILSIGIPSGLQNSVISIANIFVQASVNSFGSIAMAGNGAYIRIQGFVFIPITSFALSITTFTSQNLGAGEYDRVKKASRFSFITAMVLSESIGAILYVFMPTLLTFFSKNPEVLAVGLSKAYLTLPFFVFLALSHVMAGLYRGAGKSIVPMVVMFSIWCIFRVIFIVVALSIHRDIRILFAAYPITWSISSIIFIIYYFKVDWMGIKKLKITEEQKAY
ncbi:MAG: MATE family efflux transporter [Spirochaetaceae bacterium]|nr:MATE family efflux transporter [Spirochaetaceae bacterium]